MVSPRHIIRRFVGYTTSVLRGRMVYALFLFHTIAVSQDISLSASVDNATVGQDEQFTLQFVLNGAGMNGGKNFRVPDMSKFLILSGPNQSSNMQIINGAVSSSVTYAYVLQPRDPGKFTIGSATVEVGGKQYRSQPIEMTVTKSSAKAKRQPGSPQADASVQVGENLFLRATVDKPRVTIGEQLIVTYKIYTRVRIANYSINKLPGMTGFWGEDLQIAQQVNLSTETVNGKQYQVGVLKKTALFPTQTGNLEINPLEIVCQVQVQSRNRSNDVFDQFFNDPFFGGTQLTNVGVKSAPVKVAVLPLPKAGAPASFKGAVGKFTLNASLTKRSVKTNEPLSLKAVISGTGNIKVLEAPTIHLPNDFEKYDPKVSESIERSGNAVSGSKTFEWLIVPRYPGSKKIPPMEFSYFDPAKGKYITVKTDEFNLVVEKGSAEAPQVASGLSKEDIKLLNQDIRYIKLKSNIHAHGDESIEPATAAVLTIVPIVGFIGLLVYRRKTIRDTSDVVSFRSRKAMKIAEKRLKTAKILLASADAEEFYAEISRALWQYVSDKLAIDRAELSIDSVTQQLKAKNISVGLVSSVKDCLESCEFARFAPASSTAEEKRKMYGTAAEIIVAAEKELTR